MYTLTVREFGLFVCLKGCFTPETMEHYFEELKQLILRSGRARFSVLADIRLLLPLDEQSIQILQQIHHFLKAQGMMRSVTILQHPITAEQVVRLTKESGIIEWQRFIDAKMYPGWQRFSFQWLLEGIEPPVYFPSRRLIFSSEELS